MLFGNIRFESGQSYRISVVVTVIICFIMSKQFPVKYAELGHGQSVSVLCYKLSMSFRNCPSYSFSYWLCLW